MAPSKLLDDDVTIDKGLANVHRMIAAYLVISDAFVLTLVAVSIKLTLAQLVSQGSWLLWIFLILVKFLSIDFCYGTISISQLLVLVLLSFLTFLLLLLNASICILFLVFVIVFVYLVLASANLVLIICLPGRVEARSTIHRCSRFLSTTVHFIPSFLLNLRRCLGCLAQGSR